MNVLRPRQVLRASAVYLGLCTYLVACAHSPAKPSQTPPIPAGTTWRKLDTPAYRGKQDDIFFLDAERGFYGNGAGKIYATRDGGETWTLKLDQPGTYFRTILFTDANTGFAGNIGTDYFPGVTDTTPLYTTHDGGETWQAVTEIKGPKPVGLCALNAVFTKFINAGVLDERVVVHGVGRVGGPAYFLRSLDGGQHWVSSDVGDHAGMLLDVKFFDASHGLLFAGTDSDSEVSHGAILRTRDGGVTWTRVYTSSRPYELMWKASFPTRDVGYATLQSYDPDPANAQRFFVKTEDGGDTWREHPLVKEHGFRAFGVGFADENIGWIGGLDQSYETRDGGATWTPATMGRAVNKIRLIPTPHGWVGYAIGVDVYKLDARTPSAQHS